MEIKVAGSKAEAAIFYYLKTKHLALYVADVFRDKKRISTKMIKKFQDVKKPEKINFNDKGR